MGVYSRFKKSAGGFRQLVELLETTPSVRRRKMIEVGMLEDPEYTERALSNMMTFEDVISLPEAELAEVVAKAPPRIMAMAIGKLAPEILARVLRCAKSPVAVEIRDYAASPATLAEVGGAQLKIVEIARGLEREGLVRVKRIAA